MVRHAKRTDANHADIRDGLRKAGYTALCPECHTMIDQGKDLSKAERVGMWEEAHRRTMGALFESGLVGVL